ncbi:MAG: DUF167 domain-containing protein [Candidatus Buchananbacteria bacterium]
MLISIKVKPGSKLSQITKQVDGSWLIKTKAPAKENKANQEVIELLAREFKVAQSLVKIKRGVNSKLKLVEIV